MASEGLVRHYREINMHRQRWFEIHDQPWFCLLYTSFTEWIGEEFQAMSAAYVEGSRELARTDQVS